MPTTKCYIPAERRLAGFNLILPMVRAAYGDVPIGFLNVATLVEQVANALERDELEAALVAGTRLLSMPELQRLIALLEDE